ncbi:unnamed protein product [Clonostachys solani]|uniref:Zn(2)-C6 fungal-type domain-containing protein n=1 Tax=Clonostachys solani TaxID=160281 RepID=A0A9P0EQM6_9HYPO|nr:unnamed protein product [Clonostachys solani]
MSMPLSLPGAAPPAEAAAASNPFVQDEHDTNQEGDLSLLSGEQQPQKRRRRPALACEQCRRRKIKCDRNIPCNNCTKSKIPACSYAPTHIPASRSKKKATQATSSDNSSSVRTILPAPTIPSQEELHAEDLFDFTGYGQTGVSKSSDPSPQNVPSSTAGSTSSIPRSNVEQLTHRVHHLEEKLAKVVTISNEEASPYSSSQRDSESLPSNGTVSKTRYFGRSHWMNGTYTLPFVREIRDRVESGQSHGLVHALKGCKAMGRTIKEHRQQPLSSLTLGRLNISRELADQMVDAYFRTFEGVLRILHVPTFRADYERYWQVPEMTSDFFVIQLQLVLALGAPFLDEVFSMRAQAHQWIHEAQLWLMLPPEKSRMTIVGLQIMCLVTLSRQACSVGQDLVWISAGSLVRKAMHMGLHRDPSQLGIMTIYRAEMRRRLWATVLELNLQCAFDAGGPPLISWKDHDVLPPANLDDEELTDEVDDPENIRHPPETVTQMSLQLQLYKSLPLRLRLLEHANDFRASESYDDTLRFNSEVTKACRAFSKVFAMFTRNQQGQATPKVNNFHASMAEMILYRCFHTLHQPVIARSLEDPKFYFSRKIYFDGALRIMNICGIAGGNTTGPSVGDNSDFYRIIVNGTGMFRNVVIQSLPAIVLETMHKGELADLSLGYLPSIGGDFDLYAILERFVNLTLRRLRSGETNVKGYCFSAVSLEHVRALDRGMAPEELEKNITTMVNKYLEESLEELKTVARREGVPVDFMGEPVQMAEAEAMMEDQQGLDWMGDWAWDDDMAGVLWGSPRPYQDMHPPVFG